MHTCIEQEDNKFVVGAIAHLSQEELRQFRVAIWVNPESVSQFGRPTVF